MIMTTLPFDGMAKPVRKAYWTPLVVDGVTIDLAHLEPTILSCPTPGQPAELLINVRFSNHCFTEDFDQKKHSPSLLIMDHKRQRAFEQRRYNLSKNLSGIMAGLPRNKVHQTPESRNYLYFSAIAELAGEEYRVFFTLKKADARQGHHLELFVESAYPAPAGTEPKVRRPNAIRFAILALKVYLGQSVRFAAR